MKYFYLSVVIVLFCGLSACRKMPGIEGQRTPLPGGGVSEVIRTIRLDTDYDPKKFVYEEYRYDDSNRVSRYFNYEVDSAGHPPKIDTDHVITFDYPVDSATRFPTYGLENYRSPTYKLANAIHRYFYDNQNRLILDTLLDFYKSGTDRGVTISRRIHYNANSIIVDNINLDTYTSIKGSYRDSIVLDSRGNPVSTSTLNGTGFVSGPFDNYLGAGFVKNNFTYGSLENPLNKMNVSNIMAFVHTGFPGGVFYASYLAKNAYTSQSAYNPDLLNSVLTNFQYITDPVKSRISKVVFSRPGANQHGGYKTFIYQD
jgi:hypothetical protein